MRAGLSDASPPPLLEDRGPLARLVRNGVTPNIMMLAMIVGGLWMATRIKQEVFPEFALDTITISVSYPGSSPEEVERGILLSAEEGVRGIEGVKEITSTAAEGSGRVTVEIEQGADPQRVYQDIQQEINRIRTFPEDAERPVVALDVRRREVLDVQIFGDVSEVVLREAAERVRDRLLATGGITQVEFDGARDYEVHVEVPTETLRSLGITLDDVAQRIRDNAIEVPGGAIETVGGEVLLRVRERRDWAHEFAAIPLVATATGGVLTLGEVATVVDGFEDVDASATYDGVPAIGLEVYRVGDETPIGVSQAARAALAEIERELPEGISYAINNDRSSIYQQRLDLLLRNGLQGLLLVLLVLGLFLDFRLAFWVTIGIPTAFLGALLFLPAMDVTINMISMFAFIIALGIVVDDAIVAGENIYEYRERGMTPEAAAIRGARDVATPISVSIFTNIVAFLPLLFMPGTLGKTWSVIPLVVCTTFLMSWVESLCILPAHLAHARAGYANPLLRVLSRGQQAFARVFGRFVERVYGPFIGVLIRARYVTIAGMMVVLMIALGWAQSGRLGFILMPKVEADSAFVTARLPFGSSSEAVQAIEKRLIASAERVVAANGGDDLSLGIMTSIDEHTIEARIYLTPPDLRPKPTSVVTGLWRDETGELPGVESLRFEFDRGGPGGGAGVTVELSHRDIAVLDRASQDLAARLSEFVAAQDVDDGYTPGKRQLDITVEPEGRTLGMTAADIARQVRASFQGVEAIRQQRGRNEVTLRVRLPESERVREHAIESMLTRTPAGGEAPLADIATTTAGRAYTTIQRRGGRRTVTLTADIVPPSETQRVLDELTRDTLPKLVAEYPGLSWTFEGRQAEMRDSLQSLIRSYMGVVLILFISLAMVFRSYIQPLIVMTAIPFGLVGAICGHILMGYQLSMISIMGIVALSGVVVNDSLVMVDYANRIRQPGDDPKKVMRMAGVRRFRPILLTTLTTFGGLAPMIFETSRQAQFMIPMAISLGFGILFSTAITLILVPSLYVAIEDVRNLGRRITRFGASPQEQPTAA